MRAGLMLTAIAAIGFPGAVLAQGGQCARLRTIVNSPAPTIGALASLEHLVSVLKAGITMIDQSCDDASPEQRPQLYEAWKQARANCLQLTSGASSYADLPDTSACKESVSQN
jgi:hypothetical protein